MCLNRGMVVVVRRKRCAVMDRNRLIPTVQWVSAPCFLAMLGLLSGCVTTYTLPEMAWVRTDGRKIADDPALLQQGKSDIAACDANLDSGTPTASARGCMAQKGYVLVQRDQAEDVRAAYAAAAQRGAPNR
jgi:hypothetical protein